MKNSLFVLLVLGIGGLHSLVLAADKRSARSYVQESLQLFHRSLSQHQWEQGYSREFAKDFRHLASTAQGREELCSQLNQLEWEDLAVFRSTLEDEPLSQFLACTGPLLQRLDETLIERERLLRGIRARERKRLLEEVPSLGPSLERWISTQGGPVFFHGDLPRGHFALTFDDGPHPQRTPQVLSTLAEFDVLATFFVLGQNVQRHSHIIQDMASQGHSLGGHSQTHPDLSRIGYGRALDEIHQGFVSISNVLGFVDPFFRFPYGARTTALQNHLREENIATFFWNVDTLDWKIKDPVKLYDHALNETDKVDRGIILFHDIHPQTVAVLPHFLEALEDRAIRSVVFRAQD